MRAIFVTSFLIAFFYGSVAQAATLVINSATMSSGALIVKGTGAPNQTVTVDQTHTGSSNASGAFVLNIAGYSPPDCVILVAIGTARATGAVDNCRRGVDVAGHISLS